MNRINMARVIMGGFAAGLVVNIGEYLLNEVVLRQQMQTLFSRFNLPAPGGSAIGAFVLLGFALGIVAVWLYAAIRPRYGAGVKTALCAGAAVWFFACLYPGIGFTVIGLVPAGMMTTVLIWELVEVPLGTLAGAWLYRE